MLSVLTPLKFAERVSGQFLNKVGGWCTLNVFNRRSRMISVHRPFKSWIKAKVTFNEENNDRSCAHLLKYIYIHCRSPYVSRILQQCIYDWAEWINTVYKYENLIRSFYLFILNLYNLSIAILGINRAIKSGLLASYKGFKANTWVNFHSWAESLKLKLLKQNICTMKRNIYQNIKVLLH